MSVCALRLFAQGNTPMVAGEMVQGGGTYFWRQALGGMVLGQPVIRAQSLAVITDGGSLRAYSLSGRPLWNFAARGRLSPFLTRSREGTSYIARTNGTLIAVNWVGRELWRADLGGELVGPVVLGWDGRVFAPTARRIACYTASGNLLWRRDFEHRISAGPWLDQSGGILLALENGEALRIGPFGEVMRWGLPSAPAFLVSISRPASPNPSPETPVVLALHHTGDVSMLDPSSPNTSPVRLPGLPAPPLAAAGMDSRAAVVLANGQTLMLSAEGEVLWTTDSHIGAQRQGGAGAQTTAAAVLYDERGVHVLTANGATGFTACGRRLWIAALRNVSGLPALGDNGVLYSGGTDWILYAWRLDDWIAPRVRAGNNPAARASYGTGDPPPSAFSASPMRFNENMIRRELDAIQSGILAGRVGGNELEWIAFLKETAEAGAWPGGQPRITVSHRVRALRLLSRIGSGENVPWLATFFRREQNPAVRAAAAAAIGDIGIDPEGRALEAFAAVASPANVRNEQLLLSIAAATGALCRFSGPALYEAGVRMLLMLSSSDRPQSVQRQARRELESLRMGH